MIDATNLTFSYNATAPILQGVSFHVEEGKTLAVVGSSGCGKSTLLRVLAGLLPSMDDHLQGEMRIDRTALSFMFQDSALLPNLTVEENVALPLLLGQCNNSDEVRALIETVGLTRYAHLLPKQLSGGMKARVALARSFITKPQILLLDEPFSSLDVAWKEELHRELRSLSQKHETTVVIVTHDIEEAIELGDSVMCLGIEGNILFQTNTGSDRASLRQTLKETIVHDHSYKKGI